MAKFDEFMVTQNTLWKAYKALSEAGELESEVGSETLAEALVYLSHARATLERERRIPGVMVAPQDRRTALVQTMLGSLAEQVGRVKALPAGGWEAKFDMPDIHQVLGRVGDLSQLVSHELLLAPPQAEPFGNSARMALLGNWGTGIYGAPVSASSIESDAGGFQMVMHLGGIFYSGTEVEVRDRFLAFWPKVPGVLSRALNGNHEMYSGGHAYFELVLPAFGQQSSYFAFENDHWLLAALDTAYHEHDLTSDQVKWLEALIGQTGERKLILFSHHQPYSLLDYQGPALVGKLASLLEEKRVFAWYWSHEPRCVLYDPHPLWGLHGRCIGHGGLPAFHDDLGPVPPTPEWRRLPPRNFVPSGLILYGPNRYIAGHETEYLPHGYVTLEFDGPRLREFVHDADGTVLNELALA